jgi:hypothetical protein
VEAATRGGELSEIRHAEVVKILAGKTSSGEIATLDIGKSVSRVEKVCNEKSVVEVRQDRCI